MLIFLKIAQNNFSDFILCSGIFKITLFNFLLIHLMQAITTLQTDFSKL